MESNTCSQCPPSPKAGEYFEFFHMLFDVVQARKISTGAPIGNVSAERLISYGLPMEPPDPKAEFIHIGMCNINEDHLAHIPNERMADPLLFVTLPISGVSHTDPPQPTPTSHLLVDGAHRGTIKIRRGDESVPAIILTPEQSAQCCVRGWPGSDTGFPNGFRP